MRLIDNKTLTQTTELLQNELIDLFEIDMSSYSVDNIRFYNGLNFKHKNLVYNNLEYQAYPCEFKGLSFSSGGTSSRPTLDVANINKFVTYLALNYDSLVGLKVYRRQVYTNFLDSVNFTDGNEQADPNCAVTSIFIIESLKSINNKVATFELSLPCELDGLKLPKRVMLVKDFPGINRL